MGQQMCEDGNSSVTRTDLLSGSGIDQFRNFWFFPFSLFALIILCVGHGFKVEAANGPIPVSFTPPIWLLLMGRSQKCIRHTFLTHIHIRYHTSGHTLRQFRHQYKILDQIGRGGFGRVYQGYRLSDGLPVAIKKINHRDVCNWTLVDKQFIPAEICFLQKCRDCPGIVRLVDWFSGCHGFLIVMERPERFMDLFDLLNIFDRLDEETARQVFIQVLEAVIGLHERHSVVHRDIKDENIVLDMDTGDVWLCDFGAAEFQEKAKCRQFQGTRSYCPPEVFKRKCYLPLEGTVWSLGILLYTMLVGYPPFRGELRTLGTLRFPEHISQECRVIIQSCLCATPEFRITLEQLKRHRWIVDSSSAGAADEPVKLRKFWAAQQQQQRLSFGTGRTESESEEEECSYRASSASASGMPQPICVPFPSSSAVCEEEWTSANLGRLQPDSGFDSTSEAPFKSLYDTREPRLMPSEVGSNDSVWFSSVHTSPYYSLTNSSSLQEFGQNAASCGSAESLISSNCYFSANSTLSRCDTDADEEDLTIMIAPPRRKRVDKESSSEEEETIRANFIGYI